MGILSCLHSLCALTSFSTFLALGAGGGLVSTFVILFLLKHVWRSRDPALSPARLVADHFAYGRWAVSERLLLWLQGNLLFIEIPIVSGLHAGAAYRALSTITMPAYMAISAIAGVLLPMLVRTPDHPRWIRMLMPTAMVLMLFYGLLVVAFGQQAGHLVFAGRYDKSLTEPVLVVAGAGPLLFAICVVLELQLRARLLIQRVLMARLAATGVLIVVGLPVTAEYGVIGAALSLVITWLATATVHIVRRQSSE